MSWYSPDDRHLQRRSQTVSPEVKRRRNAICKGINPHNLAVMRFDSKQTQEIQTLKDQGWSYTRLSARFEASTATIFRVVNKKGLYGVDLTDYAYIRSN